MTAPTQQNAPRGQEKPMLNELEQRADNEARHAHRELVEELEAKLAKNEVLMQLGFAEHERRLAKAVAVLKEISEEERLDHIHGGFCLTDGAIIARATLAELEGEADD